jgi:LmbE family N-acetylglucosaminyl deacetylase
MLPLRLSASAGEPLSLLAIGAHPDDIEIGAGGLLLGLAESRLRARYVVLTGTEERRQEARDAARSFMPGADLTAEFFDLPEGRLPGLWSSVKEILEDVARSYTPDIIIAPSPADAHQDHRTIAEIVPTVFRDQLYLGYEIPKWDGDIGRPSMYVPLPAPIMRHKVELLNKCFPSQRGRDWWDDEVFLGLARLRGMECRARYAEAFTCTKSVIVPVALARGNAQRLTERFVGAGRGSDLVARPRRHGPTAREEQRGQHGELVVQALPAGRVARRHLVPEFRVTVLYLLEQRDQPVHVR